jgi:hypothetical protein
MREAYDSINQDALWQVLRTYGVPTHLINFLEDLHLRTQATVRLGGHLGHSFPVTNGVRQGCVATPLLFNVFLDFIVKEAFRVVLDCGVEVEFWSRGECIPLAQSPCLLPPLLCCCMQTTWFCSTQMLGSWWRC